jgi:DNA-binding transcriptional MocR family regulator
MQTLKITEGELITLLAVPRNPQQRLSLTPRQKSVYDSICSYLENHGRFPTHRELLDSLGLRSTATTQLALNKLEAKGWIYRIEGPPNLQPTVARGHRLTPWTEPANFDQHSRRLPAGTILCRSSQGEPIGYLMPPFLSKEDQGNAIDEL